MIKKAFREDVFRMQIKRFAGYFLRTVFSEFKNKGVGKMGKIKGLCFICLCILCINLITACGDEKHTLDSVSGQSGEKVHDDIDAENISHVNISGNARSIIIKQSEDNSFEFYNDDLNADHKYEVSCKEDGSILNISVMMENAEADNNILGSFVVYIPRKEFEEIETTGEFNQIHVDTLNSDVFVHANKSVVVLELEADQLDHNITLDGSESSVFRGVSVYLDKLPDNIRMDFNTVQDGTIDDPQQLLEGNRLESGSGKPVISIHNAETIDIYVEETL